MDVVQLVALGVGILGLVWHQQRCTDKLRAEFRSEIATLRAEMQAGFAALRAEMQAGDAASQAGLEALRAEVAANGQRLARIEGYFGLGMPAEAAAVAAGARNG